MAQFIDQAAMNAALKELYDGQGVPNMVYSRNPALALIKKRTDFGGKNHPLPVITAVSQGRSATFANAQANQTADSVVQFSVTRARDYSLATLDNETMLASASDKMAFISGAKLRVDGAYRSITNSLASALFRSGTGSIGQIGSITVSGSGPYVATITMKDANDIVQIEKMMTICASATDGAAVRAPVGFVQSVNRSTGVFTASFTVTPGSVWGANDFLSVQGDLNAKIKGFAAWLPAVDPVAGDSFFGLDRSQDPTRLAGIRYDGSAQSIEEAMIDAAALLGREDGEPDTALVNFASYAALEKSLGAKVQYVDLKSEANIGFQGIMVTGATSKIKVLADRNCQSQTAQLLTLDTWTLHSLGECPQVLDYGDGNILRVYNADAGEMRVGYYAQLECEAPGWNATVKLSA
jgi:hypothetical protein